VQTYGERERERKREGNEWDVKHYVPPVFLDGLNKKGEVSIQQHLHQACIHHL